MINFLKQYNLHKHGNHHNQHHRHRFHHNDKNMNNNQHHRHGRRHGGMDQLLTRGRKLTSDELQLLILKQLETQPAHGYELIKFFEEHSNGMYIPSPGVIYPALTFLYETDKVSVEKQGNRKQYHITQNGKQFLDESKEQALFLWDRLNDIGQHMNEVRDIFSDHPIKSKQSYELYEARRALKYALRTKQNASEEELKRIELILRKATEAILQIKPSKE